MEIDEHSDEPLTPRELADVRSVIASHKFQQRLKVTIKTYALWIIAVGGGYTIGKDFLSRFLEGLHK